jgi:glycosyltransferase involved in cell wall biosynthesis
MSDNLISVVLSVYNAESTIERCVSSILKQTYHRFELLIIDDGSTDDTSLILKKIQQKDPRITVIRKENGGLTSARKRGFFVSKGEFICFLDSDDYLEPNYLEVLKDLFDSEENIDIAVASYYIDSSKSIIKKQFKRTIISADEFNKVFILPAIKYIKKKDKVQYPDFVWLRLYRKSTISDSCFVSERECYTEDLFFQFYSLLQARNVAISDIPLYHYVITEQSLTQKYRPNKLQMVQNRYNMVQRYCNDNKVPITQERMMGLNFLSMLGCVYNVALIKNRKQFCSECKKIRQAYSELWKFQNYNPELFDDYKQLFVFGLMKLKCYDVLYLLIK